MQNNKKSVIIIDINKFSQFTKDLVKKIKNKDKLTEKITSYMKNSTIKKIADEKIRGPKTSDYTLSLRRGAGGGKSLIDNANLINSIDSNKNGVFSNLIYSGIHNTGGTITAKNSKYLCIPATKEAKKLSQIKGVRGAIEYLKKSGWSIWVKKPCILGKKGKNGKTKALFYLKRQVKIPKQEFLYLDNTDEKIIEEIIREWLKS